MRASDRYQPVVNLMPVYHGELSALDGALSSALGWNARPRRRPRHLWFVLPALLLLALLGPKRFVLHLLFFYVTFRVVRFARRAYRELRARRDGAAEFEQTSSDSEPALHASPAEPPSASFARAFESDARALPLSAQPTAARVRELLASIEQQLATRPTDSIERTELARYAGDLRELIASFRRVPEDLRAARTELGASPEEQLSAGLTTLEAQLVRLHRALAEGDLKSFAAHSQFLKLKYGELEALPDRGEYEAAARREA